jgi:hypothetical protein
MDVLAGRSASIAEDPFGPGDPLEVARLVRRALAAAGRKGLDVTRLVVVADTPVSADALRRFTRRALGPHGGTVRADGMVSTDPDHDARIDLGLGHAHEDRGVAVLVVLGPGAVATALLLG